MTRHERVVAQGRALKRCHAMYQEAIGEAMKCESCRGTGTMHQLMNMAEMVWRPLRGDTPCPECHGSGITSCCEGACGGPGEVMNGPVPSPWEWAVRPSEPA